MRELVHESLIIYLSWVAMMGGGVRRLLPLVREQEPSDPGRGSVLDAALDAFLDFGIKRTSMGEIAKRVRISPATLYRRFAQKSDLVAALGLREVRRFLAEVDRQIDHDAAAADQITELYLAMFDGLRRNRLLHRLLYTEPEVVLPKLTTEGFPVIELGRDYLADFIRRLQSEGKLPDYDPVPLAEVLARAALSMALTPRTAIPMSDGKDARRFIQLHIVPSFGLPPSALDRSIDTA